MRYLLLACLAAAGCGDDGGGAGTDAAVNLDGNPGDDASPADADLRPDGAVATCTPASGTDLTLEEVASGLTRPVFVTAPPGDKRLFIVEQPGRIRIVKDGSLLATPFLDIGSEVRDLGNEQGLLGLAFHPDYRDNGRFFVHYTAQNPRDASVIAEYQVSADPDVASATERRLLVVDQPHTNHNAGMLAFGPDGYLFIGMGDGGSADDPDDNGEDPTTLLGSMLRIDVDGGDPYGIPADNPYASSAGGTGDPRPEIWAIGLRNPWRFSFDRQTGDLYIADVGQNEWEEVNVAPSTTPGIDYGWNRMEGSSCFEPATGCDQTGLHLPVAEYQHADNGPCSVTGGYVYRGSCLPDIAGWYFYADYCTNQIWKIEYPGDTNPVELTGQLGGPGGISSFGEDATGELYITSLGDGRVYRIVAP